MGLDNIPNVYPCQKKGGVILDKDGRIDCDKTLNAGNCPWKQEYESNVMVSKSKPTYGMLGTHCWYRGKYGNALIRLFEYGEFDPYGDTTYSFYGEGFVTGEEGMSPGYCIEMSKWMAENTENFAEKAHAYAASNSDCDPKQLIADWIYASWWLSFVSENANGSKIWY